MEDVMKRLAVAAVVLISGVFASGCYDLSFGAQVKGSGVKASEERALDPFTSIELTGAPDVHVTVGGEQAVLVEADDNLLELVETRVRGRTLKIETRESYSSRLGVTITLTTPALESVSVAGSGDVTVEGVDADSFEVSVTGSGDVRASGKSRSVEAAVTGSGDIDLSGLEAVRGYAHVTGSGDIRIHATEELTAKIMGSGDVDYTGSPGKVDSQVVGSGDVKGH
jgi:hypothetical protein